MIEFDLSTYLQTRSPVTALVDSRLYAERKPQNVKSEPSIVYRVEGGERTYHSLGSSGLVETDIEMVISATTYPAARAVYEIIRDEIDGFRGEWNGTEIDRATVSPPVSASFSPFQGDDTGIPAVRCSVNVWHVESIPTRGVE